MTLNGLDPLANLPDILARIHDQKAPQEIALAGPPGWKAGGIRPKATTLTTETGRTEYDNDGAEASLRQFCEWFDLEMPKLRKCKGSLTLTDRLMQFIQREGLSIDWLVMGDRKHRRGACGQRRKPQVQRGEDGFPGSGH